MTDIINAIEYGLASIEYSMKRFDPNKVIIDIKKEHVLVSQNLNILYDSQNVIVEKKRDRNLQLYKNVSPSNKNFVIK